MEEKTLKQLAEEFQFYMLWGEYREYKECKMYVEEEKDVLLAVKKAYIDMTPRTIAGLGMSFLEDIKDNSNLKNLCIQYKEGCIKQVQVELAKEIANIFQGKISYDHSQLCEGFNDSFYKCLKDISDICLEVCKKADITNKKILDDDGINEVLREKSGKQYLYGKAQKIVNMTFKYLTLFNNAIDYEEIFEKCDMPIDSIIINYFKDIDKKQNHKGEKKIIQTNTAWSKLTKSEYDNMRNAIENYCVENMTGRMLYDEFAVWGGEQKKEKEEKNKNLDDLRKQITNALQDAKK